MVVAKAKAKTGKKQRKWGRNAIYCAYYRSQQKAEKSKVRRLTNHLSRFPDDACAVNALKLTRVVIRGF